MSPTKSRAGSTRRQVDVVLDADDRDASPDLQLALDTAEYYLLKPADARGLLESIGAAVRGWADEASKFGVPQSEIEGTRPAFSIQGA